MKNNLKKIRILLIMLFALFFSCEKDLYENAINQEKNGYKFKSIKLSEVKKHNIKTSNAINKIQNYSENASLRTTEAYGKIIDTTNVNYLAKEDGSESFTFRILQPEGLKYFENIIINNYPNGAIEVLSAKFNLNKTLELTKIQNNLNESLVSTEVSKYNKDTNTFSSYECITIGYYDLVSACEGDNEGYWECYNEDGSEKMVQVFVTIYEDCSFDSGGGNSGGVTIGNPPTGGGSSSEGGSGGESGAIFIPNPYEGDPDPSNASFVFAGKVSTFLNTLKINNPVIQNILTSNYWVYPAIVDFMRNNDGLTLENKDAVSFALNNIETVFNSIYQNSNNLSESEINQLKYKAFIFLLNNPNSNVNNFRELMGFIASNNIEIDYIQNNNNSNLMSFNTISEFDTFIQSMNSGQQGDGPNVSNVETQNQFFSTKKININSTHTIIVEVVANKSSNITLDSQSNSYLDGFLPGNTWVQTTMSMTNQNYSSNEALITLTGYINVGIKYGDIEFGFKHRKMIKFLINKVNGQLCCAVVTNID